MKKMISLQESINSVIELTDASNSKLAVRLRKNFNRSIVEVIQARNHLWLQSAETCKASEEYVYGLMQQYSNTIKEILELESYEVPEVMVTEDDDFLNVLNDSEDMTNSQLGRGYRRLASPPTMYLDQKNGRVVLPENYLIRYPQGQYRGPSHTDFVVKSYLWNRQFLELISFELAFKAGFRQARNEWKEQYIPFLQAVDPKMDSSIRVINDAVTMRAKIEATLQNHSSWGIFAAADLVEALQSEIPQITYRLVAGFQKEMPLSKIAMLDILYNTPDGVVIALDQAHPSFNKKRSVFES